MILSGNKSSKESNSVQNEVVNNVIDWENIEVTTIKFKLKNSTGKDISKIYMRNNLNENFTDDLAEDIKNGEEKEDPSRNAWGLPCMAKKRNYVTFPFDSRRFLISSY